MFQKLQDLKGEPKKIYKNGKEITVEYEMKMITHNGSGFDSSIILDNLSEWCRITNMIKTGKGIINMKIYNGMCNVKSNSKGQPQYLIFNCSDILTIFNEYAKYNWIWNERLFIITFFGMEIF